MKKICTFLAASAVAFAAAPSRAASLPKVHRSSSTVRNAAIVRNAPGKASTQAVGDALGIGLNLDEIGRLPASLVGTLFRTSINIANNTDTSTHVDAWFVGRTQSGPSTRIEVVVGVSNTGIFASGTDTLADHSVYHSDDFIDDLKTLGLITQAEEDAGIVGSLFVVYDGFDQNGQGSVEGRLYSSNFGGTIGASGTGHELTTDEPLSIVGIARNTETAANSDAHTPRVHTNFFINNEGYAKASTAHPGTFDLIVNPVTIRLTGYSNATGAVTGQSSTIQIQPYETVGISRVFDAVHGDSSVDDSLVVFVDIISGDSAISGLATTNDEGTKDPSSAQLRPADWSR